MEQKCQTSPELHSSRIVHRGNLTSIVVWNFGHTRYIYYELICFCLSLFGFLKQGNRNWVAKQQTFMSHSSGTGKSKVKALADSMSGETPFSGSQITVLSQCQHRVEWAGELSGISSV